MEKRPSGFFMTFAYPDGKIESYKIERLVGSRRIEQYVAKQNGQYFRLPVAYDLMNKRWMNLNGSFFYPDGDNFKQHFTQWDTNCVFCHNVKAQPNYNFDTKIAKTEEASWASRAEHVTLRVPVMPRPLPAHPDKSFVANQFRCRDKDPDPLGTGYGSLDDGVWPLSWAAGARAVRSDPRNYVGRRPVQRWRRSGGKYDRPVHSDTLIGQLSFANRFWQDGSPRLTAYEYQGITGSACYLKGKRANV